ncbi:MAG: NAD-dependent epimerase/dehydratase family protein [Planctomycetes bacterium]|nr:NAD-dependent epimerase/dehydratase family protein [Planctomycetota bacterium]|tara:strand:+ start:91 stop:1101 length:1011 start_codon:yes stop_codon:yes gene_type:complete
MRTLLVTGVAGFIGFHTAVRLLDMGYRVVGVDNINDYYSVALKHDRLAKISGHKNAANFTFVKADLASKGCLSAIFERYRFDEVIHLGAQAGVRYSIQNPQAYVDSNVTGTLNVFELSSMFDVKHVLYASSSSVYGNSVETPFSSEKSLASHPVSMYAATKRMNEMMAHVYAHQNGLPLTGLRFFTVYGPWGRPDMAMFKFAERIINGQPIELYNHGEHYRDFTYVSDIVQGIVSLLDAVPKAGVYADDAPDRAVAPCRVFNIGAQTPVHLMTMVNLMEEALQKKAVKIMLPMQTGDVMTTNADVEPLVEAINYRPQTTLKDGVFAFVDWFRTYYR